MLFNSFIFIGFFFIVLVILFLERIITKNVIVRNISLLLASYFFYGYFNLYFLIILIFVTAINYMGGSIIIKNNLNLSYFSTSSNIKNKNNKCSLIISAITIILSLFPLIFFKYSIFVWKFLTTLLNWELNIEFLNGLLLPVGISFFTFQALSFTIDAYRGKISHIPSIVDFFLFVSFFPTILSGPIEKARNLLPQIKRYFFPDIYDIAQGFSIFTWGLFKKIVIADRLAAYIDWAYATSQYAYSGTLLLAAIFYSIQIYCDFSGYSDMALGVAKALGFNITKNFRQPYLSRTFKEFWRKWHIALTSWFTEYVYFSLGGNRVKHKIRWVVNISTIFILSGIWHGAAWGFIIWGLLHAFFYLIEYFLGLQKKSVNWNWLTSTFAGIIVFLLTTFAWIFFRLDFSSATFTIGRIFSGNILQLSMGSSSFVFACTLAMLLVFFMYELLIRFNFIVFDSFNFKPKIRRNVFLSVPLLLIIALFGLSSDNFVYFQF